VFIDSPVLSLSFPLTVSPLGSERLRSRLPVACALSFEVASPPPPVFVKLSCLQSQLLAPFSNLWTPAFYPLFLWVLTVYATFTPPRLHFGPGLCDPTPLFFLQLPCCRIFLPPFPGFLFPTLPQTSSDQLVTNYPKGSASLFWRKFI